LAATKGVEGRMTHPDIRTAARSKLFGAVIAALLSLAATPGRAAEVVERPYDPPVGSHWIIESETRTEDNRPEGLRSSLINMRSEMNVEAKTPDGFRISYVNRGTAVEGNDPMVPLFRSTLKALENVPILATTDRAGKPLATLQAYLRGEAPYVSVAMDSAHFAYGTKLRIPLVEKVFGRCIEFRVVDTGGWFEG